MIIAKKTKHVQIPDEDILYIMTTLPPGKVVVVTKDDEIGLWNGIGKLQEQLPHLIRPSAATLLNPEIIEFIDYKRQKIETSEGLFKIARSRIDKLKEQINDSDYEFHTSCDQQPSDNERLSDNSLSIRGDNPMS